MILTNHGVLVDYFYKPLFNCFQFTFQAANIFFFGSFELFQDLLLSLKLSINVFMLSLSFTDRSLKLLVLSSQDFDLSGYCLKLDLCIFGGKNLIFMLTLGFKQFSISFSMIILLILIPLNPHLTGFLFSCDDLIQGSNLFCSLFLAQLQLSFDALFLNVEGFLSSLQVNNALVQILNLSSLFTKRLLLDLDNLLQTLTLLNFFPQLYLSFMTNLVGQMELLSGVLKVFRARLVLFLNLSMIDLQAFIINSDFLNINLHLMQISLVLFNSLLSLPRELIRPDHSLSNGLVLSLNFIELNNQLTTFSLITLLEIPSLLEFHGQVSTFGGQTVVGRSQNVCFQLGFCQFFLLLLQFVFY